MHESPAKHVTAFVPVHVPAWHIAEAFGPATKARLHPPQWAADVSRFASQPSAIELLQSRYGAVHAPIEHAPAKQTATALAGAQLAPHAPQAAVFESVSTQLPLQQLCPDAHCEASMQPAAQVAPVQCVPGGQCRSEVHATHVCIETSQ